jgi:hypothetical protein
LPALVLFMTSAKCLLASFSSRLLIRDPKSGSSTLASWAALVRVSVDYQPQKAKDCGDSLQEELPFTSDVAVVTDQ